LRNCKRFACIVSTLNLGGRQLSDVLPRKEHQVSFVFKGF